MEITRTLKKGSQEEATLVLSIGKDDDASDALKDFGKKLAKQLKAGFVAKPLPDPVAAAKPILALKNVDLSQVMEAFTPEERIKVVARAIADAEKKGDLVGGDRYGDIVRSDLFVKCPTPELLRHILDALVAGKRPHDTLMFYASAISKVSRDPDAREWIAAEVQRAIGAAPEGDLKKWLQLRAGKFRSQTKVAAQLSSGPVKGEKTEDELLEAIGRAPDDDAPRLVWADWLLEHGNKWGEVVQAQCTKERTEVGSPGWQELWEKSRKLQTSNVAKFLAPIRPLLSDYGVTRGLLHRAAVSMEKLLKPGAAQAIVLRAPGAYLKLSGLKPQHAAAIAKLPRGRFRELELTGRTPADALAALLKSPLLEGIGAIKIWGLDEKSIGALSEVRPSVQDVCLWDCLAASAAVEALGRSAAAKAITSLLFAGKGGLADADFGSLTALPGLTEESKKALRKKAA